MFPLAAAALRAGDVVVCGRRFCIVVESVGRLGSVLVRRGPLDRLRSHVLPDVDDLNAAGLPLGDMVICCDRLRPLPIGGMIKMGTTPPGLLRQIETTIRRVAEAEAIEATPAIRGAIWRVSGGGCGRKVGRQPAI